MVWRNIAWVALGGAAGSVLRYGVSLLTGNRAFPVATLFVNVAGCFIIGLVLAACQKNEGFAEQWKLLLATGLCGGFTTFSAFAAENLQLLQNGKAGLAIVYVTASIAGGLAATWLGFKILQ